ncbi:MAG TPA: ScpA family protein [Caulobacteraceae bacterium]|nr:ScpA family protein [Caulobacteraceae bacterium]
MNAHFQPAFDFEVARTAVVEGEALIIDIDGFEGPLDLLLALARNQKVDLLKLSVSRLVDQYLAFVREARRKRFALAADYLVMAAWLAFLKSRLLLPKPERPRGDEPPPEALATQLAFRIAKLDAMRRAAEALKARPILRRDVFPRGDPDAVSVISHRRPTGDLRALMAAYVEPRARGQDRVYRPKPMEAFPLEEARAHLRALLPALDSWTALASIAPRQRPDGPSRASCIASTLSASLEMVREGELDARQLAPFSEIYLRAAARP